MTKHWANNFMEKRAYLVSYLNGILHYGGGGMKTGTQDTKTGHIVYKLRKQRDMNASAQLLFSLLFSLEPGPWGDSIHILKESSYLS